MAVKARWKPQLQSNPITINVPARGSEYNAYTTYNLSIYRDYILNLPSVRRVGGIRINGGRHVRMIKGYITPNPLKLNYFRAPKCTAILIVGNRGTVHIEGVLINASAGGTGDCIQINSNRYGLVQVQNCRFTCLSGTNNDQMHGDVFEVLANDRLWDRYAAVRELRIDQFTGLSNGNGLWLSHNGPTRLSNMNLRFYNPGVGVHPYAKLVRFVETNTAVSTPCTTRGHFLRQVYMTGYAKSSDIDQWVTPGRSAPSGCKYVLRPQDGAITWPKLPIWDEGCVYPWEPPAGDYMPSGTSSAVAGLNYVSPGYLQT